MAKVHEFWLVWLGTLSALVFKSVLLVGVVNYTEFFKAACGDVWSIVPTYNVYLAFLIMPLSLVLLLTGRCRFWLLLLGNCLLSVLFLFDLWHFRAFGTFLSLHVLSQTANLTNLGGSILSMAREEDILLFGDIPVLLVLAGLAHRRCEQPATGRRLAGCLLGLAVCYLFYAHYVFDLSAERGQRQYLFTVCWAPSQTVTGLSPLGYHLFDVYNYVADSRPLILTDSEKEAIAAWYRENREMRPDNEYKGMFAGQNLIFIQVESLESFYLKNSLGGKEITPNLNRLLKNSLYFPNFYEQVSNGTTADAEFMANTSIYPLRRGTEYFRYPNNTYNSLPKLMAKRGYTTLAIHPDNKSYWNWQYNMESIGYQLCLDSSNFLMEERIGLGLSDGSFFRQVAPILQERNRPFLAFMITLTNHTTFELPDEYKELEPDEKFAGTMLGRSFHTVHYTDRQIGNFLALLDQGNLLDNTVIVIYGDHTGVHRFYSQEINAITPADTWWQDNHHKVPFLIYQKGLTGQGIMTSGGQIDILPTVAYLMGIDEQEYGHTAIGRNLLNTGKDFAVLTDGQLMGQVADEREQAHVVQGWEVADKIICSSYYGKR
ncbi:LTA synthase family protein [Sporomusa acidovorans]|uniref:Lipoteichoic acid synthase 1 n=1 Tax=Sporomusa acidovorans (strain ATCC 49682 / DSM 3132 / Mol) TaxID=1123286 RepID=A0ABZ3J8M4_SPOA4|nr:LTA synthase family protein [Sporomusa acidovorans]OZC17490.1 lipoteichoic acid synthase 1 [Sporomusa acidovorans DSM 3132]SDF07343.1 Phosphoglycerol transferase MdoB [Sporomusa acidovorans]